MNLIILLLIILLIFPVTGVWAVAGTLSLILQILLVVLVVSLVVSLVQGRGGPNRWWF